jgi:hypothetical protein
LNNEKIILDNLIFDDLNFSIIEENGILKIREEISKIESKPFLNEENYKNDVCLTFISNIAKKYNLKDEDILRLNYNLDVWVNSAINKLKEIPEEAKQPLSLEKLKEILGITIKHDDINKVITFLAMLNAYTEDEQFNVSFRAESSTGKSYIPLEIANLFPEKDIIDLAYGSPACFFHDTAKFDKDKNVYISDLERKILIFIDMPHDLLLQRLRPLLSHDKKILNYKITDKTSKGRLKAKNIIIKGFCSVIFCTGSLSIDEQEATRMILLSPEISQEKLREAIYLKVLKNCNKEAFKKFVESNKERQLLKLRIEAIKRENIKEVVVEDPETIYEMFLENKKFLKPRYTRDIERLISIIKGFAILNLWYRKREGNKIYANEEDVDHAFELYENLYESQELNLSPFVYMIYREILIPLSNEGISIHYEDIAKKFLEKFGRTLDIKKLQREILPALETAGLILKENDPDDRRKSRFIVLGGGLIPHVKEYIVSHPEKLDELQKKILELKNKGYSLRKIAKELGYSFEKIRKEYKKLTDYISDNMGYYTPPINNEKNVSLKNRQNGENGETAKFGMADITDTADISLRDKAIYERESKKETLSKIEEKAENNQVLEGDQKEAIKESIGLSQKQMSVMSEMSAVCELCGKNEKVSLIYINKLKKKIAICENCLKEMKKDQYEILNDSQKQDIETEDYLLFSGKISKEKFNGVEFYVCKAILKKEIDKEGKEKITYCNFRTLSFDDMLSHLEFHKNKELNKNE